MKVTIIKRNVNLRKFFLNSFFLITFLFPIGAALAQSYDAHTTELMEGAKKERQVTWYAGANVDDLLPLRNGFEKRYPFIKLEITRLNDAGKLKRILAESQANRHIFDVADNSPVELETLRRKGLFAKYLSPQRNFIAEMYKDKVGEWSGLYTNKQTVTYNTKLVAPNDVPKIYEDLLDPKWKNKMAITTNDYYWFAVMMKGMGEEKGLKYFHKLAEQNLSFRTGRTLTTQLCAAGEFSIGIATYTRACEEMKSKGAHVEWVALEPVVDNVVSVSVSSHASHPNSAKLLVDFLISKEGQQIIANRFREPTRIDVDALVPRMKCEGKKLYPPNFSLADDLAKYSRLFREVLMRQR